MSASRSVTLCQIKQGTKESQELSRNSTAVGEGFRRLDL